MNTSVSDVYRGALGSPAAASGTTDIANSRKPLLVCFSHLRWDFVWQRPQHLMTRAARDYQVLFIEEPVVMPTEAPRFSLTPRRGGVWVLVAQLPERMSESDATSAQREFIQSILDRCERKAVFWYYTPMALAFSDGLKRDVTVFDNMDELSAFKGAPPGLVAAEAKLLRDSDVVFTGGASLFEAKRDRHPNVHAFPSSVDVSHFHRARSMRLERPAGSAPRLGFFGVIDERFNAELLKSVAEGRPDWTFEMVGPVVKIDPAGLPSLPNIIWAGPCPYERLPERLATWDVGIMPFALNGSTRFISPTKTPEFLAAGLPVVSTPIVDVVRSYGDAGLVEIAATAEALIAAVETIRQRPREPWLDAVDKRLAQNSWDATWTRMHALARRAARENEAMTSDRTPAADAASLALSATRAEHV